MRLSPPAIIFAFAAAVVVLSSFPAGAKGGRVALVVGNADYANAPRLPTSLNDAEDIADALTRLGFEIVLRRDATVADLRSAIEEFSRKAAEADIAIVYYAGYHLNIGVSGYLVPVDAGPSTPSDLHSQTVSLPEVMSSAGKAHSLGLVILDALHGNPFPVQAERSNVDPGAGAASSRSGGARNVLLLFAAEPSKISERGSGRNSPLASALLENLPKPGLEINFLLRNVRDHVRSATQSRQTPYMYGQLSKQRIFLASREDGPASPSQADAAKVQPCDELAAAPDDADKHPKVAGIAIEKIVAADAVAACSDAVKRFPTTNRFYYQLGRAFFAARDHDAALTSYKKAFELGSVRALYALGAIYDHGDGVDRDPERARFYYEIAAQKNFAPAIASLGVLYEHGAGVTQDPAKAHEFYRRAADLGDARAINKMGELIEKESGVAQNARRARVLYEKSARMGYPDAMVNLARCFANGIGGRKDIPEARKLLDRAAKAGSAQARNILTATGSRGRR
ncbi:MAG: caspase family protein [Xanthobacteraceae bacterium]|nr:caspase family protein [Xanthobacteraceae bacterium]